MRFAYFIGIHGAVMKIPPMIEASRPGDAGGEWSAFGQAVAAFHSRRPKMDIFSLI
jgi:hypothetical protein